MLRFCSLYSGSSGNSFLVQSSKATILVDVGVSTRKIEKAFTDLELDINSISAILITHEHSDHSKGVGTLSKKYNIPVYANKPTWLAMPEECEKIADENKHYIEIGTKFKIDDLEILPFSIPHDAACPCGYNIFGAGKKISIATDIGHISEKTMPYFENSSFVLLEANYDNEILKYSPYPRKLKYRIDSPTGHLSNYSCSKVISHLVDSGLTSVMLGHLSKENNFPELAYQTVLNELNENHNNLNIDISVANRDYPTKFIDIK